MISSKKELASMTDAEKGHAQTYSSRLFTQSVPKYELPEAGMPAASAYELVHDETAMDCNPQLNLSSFVTTWMEPEAEKLIAENIHKNFIDHAMYPQSQNIHERCINMLARLFNSPEDVETLGSATIGSSEAVMLAGLAHKWNWRKKREAAGLSTDKPNMVFGYDVQICWEKFARFFDVEMRMVPLREDDFTLDPEGVRGMVDENTICVTSILGTTFTGENDPIHEITKVLDEVQVQHGWDIPIHVDAASGGFIVPFIQPDFIWDFRLPRVQSINVSGHKYGLVYPGIGWVLFREKSIFPEDLIFYVNYLGGEMPTMTLNFSRGTSMVLAQYYNFIRLGKEGYTRIARNCTDNAVWLAETLEKSGKFTIMNRDKMGIPVVALQLSNDISSYNVFDISSRVRQRGWVLSAYTLPPNAENIAMLRIVVRENLSRDMCEILVQDILDACNFFETHGGGMEEKPALPTGSDKPHPHC
jgi:glutamate decarboxylase